METLTLLHKTNIAAHVAAGLIALIIGLVALASNKKSKLHKLAGQTFLMLIAIVILTALIGVFVFGRNTFLLVITALSGYMAISGYRAVKIRSNAAKLLDICICFAALASVSYFLYYFKSVGMIWSPVIIYSTIGYLFLMIAYDLGKYFISAKTYTRLWLPEHILKMTSALSGLLSAFSGTVLPQYQPYSQFLPSVLGTLVALAFIIKTTATKMPNNTDKTLKLRF